jgi:hypothetical protein
MIGFEAMKKYFSGKHQMYCLTAQIVTRRDGIAVQVIPGVPGAMHDMKLFRQTTEELERLIAAHPVEPVHFFAYKGYFGDTGLPNIIFHTEVRVPKQSFLTIDAQKHNHRLAKQRTVVEKFFGRLQNKCQIIVRRWHLSDAHHGTIFRICRAITNLDIRVHGGTVLRAEDGRVYPQRLFQMTQESHRRFL